MIPNNSDKTKICKNCNYPFTDRFCNHCGQQEFTRFNYKDLLQTIKSDLFDIETGLLLTFKELWTKPGLLVLNYINGIRIKYYSPLKYLAFWTAIYLLVIPFTTTIETENSFQELVINKHEIISTDGLEDFLLCWYQLMTKVTNIYFIGLIPFLAEVNLVINRTRNFNFTEILILQTYFCGQFAFVAVVSTMFSTYISQEYVFGISLTNILISVPYWYLFIKMQREFFSLSWITAISNSIVTILFGTLTYLVFLFLIFTIFKLLLT